MLPLLQEVQAESIKMGVEDNHKGESWGSANDVKGKDVQVKYKKEVWTAFLFF